MTAKSIESILDRAMSDAKFAAQILTNPKEALAGFDLTDEEVARFERFSRADFEAFNRVLSEEDESSEISFDHDGLVDG